MNYFLQNLPVTNKSNFDLSTLSNKDLVRLICTFKRYAVITPVKVHLSKDLANVFRLITENYSLDDLDKITILDIHN